MDPSAKPSTHLPAQPNVPSYALPMLPVDGDDGISYKGFFAYSFFRFICYLRRLTWIY